MDLQEKLAILADAAKYDASCASSGAKRGAKAGGIGNSDGTGICHSYTPDGRCVSLLKILLTNHCIFDCAYCINRVSSNVQRARFTPQEVADLTMEFYRRNYIEGLFLSSGVIGSPDATMEQLIEAARLLREVHLFGGYIHLKAVAGCSPELVTRAGRYADRLSANIELPRAVDLATLAPAKTMDEIEKSMAEIKGRIDETRETRQVRPSAKIAKPPKFAPAGQSTQMVVGATPSTDSDILTTSTRLYSTHNLRRVYYTAFSPIPHSDPRLPSQAPPLLREHRLYQADWLMRFYGFSSHELFTPSDQNLRTDMSPKLAWALRNLEIFPVNVNTASREMLLRVPGIGVRNVNRIVMARRHARLRLDDLRKLRVNLSEAQFFIETADGTGSSRAIDKPGLIKRFNPQPQQLTIFSALTGEV